MKIAILINDHLWTYNLRRELIECLMNEGHEVTLVLPYGEKVEYFRELGCDFVAMPFEKHGTNVFKEYFLYRRYIKILKEIKPDIVLTYTTKPNIYGGMACSKLGIPYISSITGIGNAMQGGLFGKLMTWLYKSAMGSARMVFFQNETNMKLFCDAGICKGDCCIVPGSGVNIDHHGFQKYPDEGVIRFLFIGRLNPDKGLRELIEASKRIRKEFLLSEIHIVGMAENKKSTKLVSEAADENIVIYHGATSDVRDIIGRSHCTVLPSYHEGMANVLLESASAGRPIITTDVAGCKEIVEDGKTGFICKVKDSDDLYEKMKMFLKLPHEERAQMGEKGRQKIVDEFSRSVVVEKYMEVIMNVLKELS